MEKLEMMLDEIVEQKKGKVKLVLELIVIKEMSTENAEVTKESLKSKDKSLNKMFEGISELLKSDVSFKTSIYNGYEEQKNIKVETKISIIMEQAKAEKIGEFFDLIEKPLLKIIKKIVRTTDVWIQFSPGIWK